MSWQDKAVAFFGTQCTCSRVVGWLGLNGTFNAN